MRKKLLLILFLGVLACISARSQERVYISTDKDCYVAGDRIWCSAFCFDITRTPRVLSDFSSTVYLELQSNTAVSQVAKIALIHGRGAGALELSADLPTGNYTLVAYTAQNKNEEGFVPSGKPLTVFNVLSGAKVKDNVEILEAGQVQQQTLSPKKNIAAGNSASIQLSMPETAECESTLPVSIKNNGGSPVSLSISVFHQDGLSSLEPYSIADAVRNINAASAGSLSLKTVPDYEGEVIKLRTHNVGEGVIHVSFPGRGENYYASKIDSTGCALIFTPNIAGNKDVFCEITSSSLPGDWSVEIEDPFIKQVIGGFHPLKIYESMAQKLQERGFSMQLDHRFDKDTLYQLLPQRKNTFLSGEKNVYLMDDYTRFPLMEEVIVEFVSELRIRKVQKEPQILVSGNGPSLIMLDGVPIFDHKTMINYDPLLVKDIEIYPGNRSLGLAYYDGIACFNTYKGNMPSYTFPDNIKILPFKGTLIPLSYTGAGIKGDKSFPDYRQTVYWHPIITIPAGESFDFECITPVYSGNFDIVVEGVNENGEAVYYKGTFSTKN